MNINAILVEDNLDLAAAIIDYLETESILCDHASNGIAGLAQIQTNHYQVILLDLNLPRMDGLCVAENLRKEGIDTPILMLTARDSLEDKLAGFAAGTDDYLIKPFAMMELVVRIRALANRRSGQINQMVINDLVLNLTHKQAYRQQQLLKLTPTELKILETMMRASPNTVSRAELLDTVWGNHEPDSNSLKVHIHNLRKQVDGNFLQRLIHTVPGFGFVLKE